MVEASCRRLISLRMVHALPRRHKPLRELDDVVDDDADDSQNDQDGEGQFHVHGAGAFQKHIAQTLVGPDELRYDGRRGGDGR